MLQFASNYASSYSTDLIIIAGDYNSSPNTPVYNMMTADGYVDSLVDKLGAGATADVTYATWGRDDNTWSGPGGTQADGHKSR